VHIRPLLCQAERHDQAEERKQCGKANAEFQWNPLLVGPDKARTSKLS
jgi:hypothetical protein